MKTKKNPGLKNLGLSRDVAEGQGLVVTGRGVRIVVRAWRRSRLVRLAVSAPAELAIGTTQRIEEEEGLLPGELRGGLVTPRPGRGEEPIDAILGRIMVTAVLLRDAALKAGRMEAIDSIEALRRENCELRQQVENLRGRLFSEVR
jgi:hypothetical protein